MVRNRTGDPRPVVVSACLAAAVVTTGVQGIAPALPAAQMALALSDAQVSLITSVYLLPGFLLAFPAGILTERIGRRAMFCLSLLVFAAGGAVLLAMHSLGAILVIRAVQGAAFAAILALTITLIGDVLSGPAQATGQGRRIISITVGEVVFPAAAGALVAVAWFVPFALQLAALPVAILGWFIIPEVDRTAERPKSHLRLVLGSLSDPGIGGLQVLAFLRFFFKFSLITYYPLVAIGGQGISPAVVGLALGTASLLGTVTAAVTGRVLRRTSAARTIGASITVIVAAFLMFGTASSSVGIIAAVLVFGPADGLFAVAHNVLVTEAAPAGSRAAFVAMTGTVRNLGKLTAPLICGGLTLFLPLPSTFLIMGVIGAFLGLAVLPVGRLETRLPVASTA